MYPRAFRRVHIDEASRTTLVRGAKTVWKQRYFGHNADYLFAIARRRVIVTSLYELRARLR
jgi:hypothetical protein